MELLLFGGLGRLVEVPRVVCDFLCPDLRSQCFFCFFFVFFFLTKLTSKGTFSVTLLFSILFPSFSSHLDDSLDEAQSPHYLASLVAQMVKNPPAMQETPGLIPGLGRSPGEWNGCPLHYSCLEDPMDRGAWRAAVGHSQSDMTL